MQFRIIRTALLAAALLLSAGLSLAAESKPAAPAEAVGAPKAAEKGAKAAKAAKAAPVKLVDINSAGKAELKTLPGISDAEADKIIGARPYGSKAQLYTRNIVSGAVYDNIKEKVIAMQKQTTTTKSSQK